MKFYSRLLFLSVSERRVELQHVAHLFHRDAEAVQLDEACIYYFYDFYDLFI